MSAQKVLENKLTTANTLRQLLGCLGIALPLILWVVNCFQVQPSISHFYYTQAGIVFTSILAAFGLFLISYRGYEPKENEISDNTLTTIAGVLAIITALFPTESDALYAQFEAVNSHQNQCINVIHISSAAGFFALMGIMATCKFTKMLPRKEFAELSLDEQKRKINRNKIYRFCGYIIFISLALLIGLEIYKEKVGKGQRWFEFEVLIGETIILLAFGTAWLIKGSTTKRKLFNLEI